ncbi:MAG: hypothetical protein U9R00_01325 [Patescibacteria group bacterium]|nr:hypothetical protein [Patescibacteria group bacterium]
MKKGIGIIELLLAIAIISVIVVFVFPSLISFKKEQVLRNSVDQIISLSNKARNDTLTSKNLDYYGIEFESDRVTLIEGSSNSDLEEIILDNFVEINGISLNGDGNIVYFNKLTGDTDEYGSVIIRLVDQSKQRTIFINKTGIITK